MIVASLVAWTLASLVPQDPVALGVLTSVGPGPDAGTHAIESARLDGVRWAVRLANERGGVDGRVVELVEMPCAKKSDVTAAVASLLEKGAFAVLPPLLDSGLADAAARAAKGKLACVRLSTSPEDVLAALERLFEDHHLVTRIALVRDQDRSARDFAKLLASSLQFPTELVTELDLRKSGKKLDKVLAESRPEILVLDAEPEDAARYLAEQWADSEIPFVLTPRAFGAETQALGRPALVVLGRSPATLRSSFREAWEKAHPEDPTIAFGLTEGYEAALLALRALDAADSPVAKDVLGKLGGITAEGARGLIEFDKKRGDAAVPVGVWSLEKAAVTPYFPAYLSLEAAAAGTDGPGERKPDDTLGESFGNRRLRDFEFEPGTQWVHCVWAYGHEGYGKSDTIDKDLKLLGLSTEGAHPLIDRIIKDELMARVISITSTKFGRRKDGTSIPGKSLKISFAAYRPEGKKRRLWPAKFAGDDDAAGGRAYGTYCEVYSSFIRRTIFQEHALDPAVGPDDLPYLDGSYEFGTDHIRDKRSELIRALINGYGGSMALTTAHEVGHLAGLGHITDDPRGIMNVAEGGGLDYRDAAFSAGSWEKLVESLGLTEEPDAKKSRKRGR